MRRERIILQLGTRRDMRSLGRSLHLWNKRALQTLHRVQHRFLSAWREVVQIGRKREAIFFSGFEGVAWWNEQCAYRWEAAMA
jgi:hypothetical protein